MGAILIIALIVLPTFLCVADMIIQSDRDRRKHGHRRTS
jgi:hypothetical protein